MLASALLAAALALAGATTPADDCTSVTKGGWYTCAEDGDIGAIPHAGLVHEHYIERTDQYALAVCLKPHWAKVWASPRLRVAFISRDLEKPLGPTTVEVATGSPGTKPDYRRYAAHGELGENKPTRTSEVLYHGTRVEGAAAHALLEQVSADTERWWLWRNAGQEAPHAIGRRTLARPARKVLNACEGGDDQ